MWSDPTVRGLRLGRETRPSGPSARSIGGCGAPDELSCSSPSGLCGRALGRVRSGGRTRPASMPEPHPARRWPRALVEVLVLSESGGRLPA